MTTPVQALQFAGLTSSIFLSGTYFSSSKLTLPILYRLPTATSTSVFSEFYYRGPIAVVPMAIVSTLPFGTVAYLLPEQRTTWGTAAIAPILTLPWTTMIMMGMIQRLLKLDQDKVEREKAGPEGVVRLLKMWRWMNFVRSGMALVGGGVAACTLIHYNLREPRTLAQPSWLDRLEYINHFISISTVTLLNQHIMALHTPKSCECSDHKAVGGDF
jgi:Domain of unknown function (DUF1772)